MCRLIAAWKEHENQANCESNNIGQYTNTCPKNISAVKKGEAKKVQVTEQPKGVISL